ncbi:MAG: SpoIID/LytB domain-containing protein [Elusimicrobiota bacterium]
MTSYLRDTTLALFLLFVCRGHCAAGAAENGPRIRVAISRNVSSLKLKTSSRIYSQEVKSGQKYLLLGNASYDVRSTGKGIAVAGQELSSPIRLLAPEGVERIRLGGNLYKGDVLIKAAPGGLLDIIEYLSLEEYLYGVLPAEMSPGWPLEALKAQAVASRTYAMKFINPARDYDITNGAEMQVYTGVSKVNSRIMEAVNSTRGEVLKYKGRLVTAFFHACCGGHTASVKSAWGEDIIKPLYGVADPFCSPSRHYRWEFYLSSADLLKFIQSRGSTALKIKNMRIHQKDRSGRTVSFKFTTDKSPTVVKTTDLRKHFGAFEFRSTYIIGISPVKSGYELAGRGWGHGVGMCQEGARYMALKGRPYRKILRHYYPGAAITDYE